MVQCHHLHLERLVDIEAQCLLLIHKGAARTPADEGGLWQHLELGSIFATIFQVGALVVAGMPAPLLNHLLKERHWLAPCIT